MPAMPSIANATPTTRVRIERAIQLSATAAMFLLLMIVCVVIFLFLLCKPIYDAHLEIKKSQTDYNETVDERIDYMRNVLQRRRFVPLSALPNIVFNTNLGTINEGESKCLSVPIYVGFSNTPNFDCTVLCDNPAAVYFYADEYDKFVINGQMLLRGGYCTTSSVPRNCNRETSVIIHSLNQWSCIAEDPRYFSGIQNINQVAGRQHIDRIAPGQANRNVLFDRLLGVEVDVTRNTFRSHWDEEMPDGSGRRFEMRCNALDDHNNRMFVNPFNPIECLPNVCTNVNFVMPDVRPNFETGECECGDFEVTRVRHLDPDDKTSMCAAVVDTFDERTLSLQYRVDCMNLDMPVEKYDRNMLWCPSNIFNQNTDNAFLFTVPGSFPISGNGIDEPTWRLYMEMRNRIEFNVERPRPPV
ncbi:ORF35 [Spodoptera exigua multiple nucleopolyhedrovirus]|uniref:ORF35 n=1 Tax=Spodoptera exigua nuclear polyhedrosis virus (strain US) TaxID=31506 RepID=Q9J8A0_NPVSE|nr:ORF35 [Spodoptera exigua multiple nucleopolyhedrovirus]AAF33565.1 ORF35 [Spodoptera exigua multiple nucleopolyhedrovirus]